MSRYDDFDHLISELEMEKRYREGIEMANEDLERDINDLENYLRSLDEATVQADDNEWKVRSESQTALNVYLSDQKGWLEAELAEIRWKCHAGQYPDAMNFNLDLLTELELVRLVKHMERMRGECYSTLRDLEYKIDKEAKEFRQLDDARRNYRADLKHARQTVERKKLEEMMERRMAAVTDTPPVHPSSFIQYLDEHALDDPSPPSPKSSKSKSKSKSKDGGGGEKQKKENGEEENAKSETEADGEGDKGGENKSKSNEGGGKSEGEKK